MTIISNRDYNKAKYDFLASHDDWQVTTSPMDEYGSYNKTYVCDNGDVLYEVMRPTHEQAPVEVKGVQTKVEIKLLECEMWTNKWGSKYTYEIF